MPLMPPCPLCQSPLQPAGDAPFNVGRSENFRTPIHYCAACRVFVRQIEEDTLTRHFEAASYTNPVNEDRFRGGRVTFFRYLLRLVMHHLDKHSTPLTLIDFGSAYGHLLEITSEFGVCSIGIEINAALVAACRERGLEVYSHLADMPPELNGADAVTMIDSLYYLAQPHPVLAALTERLKPGGIVAARVTNRLPYARLARWLRRRDPMALLGDATISYSRRGVRRLFERAGYRILSILPEAGTGKRSEGIAALAYGLTGILARLTGGRLLLTPGMIILARWEG
ncbi:MAG TPA: methyltransferase domain-containing protein [Aggregatilineales bacterium]|nr:methyltransferase domain-containing protein [Anaerolineales bacterium]HRE48003.1 methyltransferase domain-containing protein [Aggregatilineales bacterium]